jgi:ubiquinone/menaquinone biosynthesis C-methylase UbiE
VTFGQSAALFDQIRRDYYTRELIDTVVSLLGAGPNRHVLDVGCGTGIAARQLAERGFTVTGVDVDADMVDVARQQGGLADYHVMRADALAFDAERFCGVTAFSAFHWFYDDPSVQSIKRVLQTGGCFVTINKTDTGPFRRDMVAIVRKHVPLKHAEPRIGYRPAEILRKNGFHKVQELAVNFIERWLPDTAITYARTTRFWEEVPPALQDRALADLAAYIHAQLDSSGHLVRPITANVVVGYR